MIAGPLVGWIFGELKTSTFDIRSDQVEASLNNLGISSDVIRKYEEDIKNGKFIILLSDTSEKFLRIKKILSQFDPDEVQKFIMYVNGVDPLPYEIQRSQERIVIEMPPQSFEMRPYMKNIKTKIILTIVST